VAEDRIGPENLDDFTVIGDDGALVPLSVVADFKEVRGWARIHRVNGRRAVNIRGNLDPSMANARELLALAASDFIPGLLERYPDLSFEVAGQGKEGAKTSRSIGHNVLLGLIGVYMLLALLALQFRSCLAPIAVMLVIPTTLIGVVFGHLILGLDLTLPSIVGMASLFGVVVNDSILFGLLHPGSQRPRHPDTPSGQAGSTGTLSAHPAHLHQHHRGPHAPAAGESLQAQILIPLAASLAFGLARAAIAALFLVPTLYAILDSLGWLRSSDTAPSRAEWADIPAAHGFCGKRVRMLSMIGNIDRVGPSRYYI